MKTILFFIISSYSFSTSTASTSSSLTVDWNEQILTAFIDMIKEGYAKFIPNLIVILSLLTVLEIIWSIFRTVNRGIGREAIIVITKILIKFGLYFYLITNANSIIEKIYEVFKKIGSTVSNSGIEGTDLNKIWSIVMLQSVKIIQIMNTWDSYITEFSLNQKEFFSNFSKIALLIFILLLLYLFVGMIIANMLLAIIQFFMCTGLGFLFVPFDVNSVSSDIIGKNKILNIFFIAGLKVTVISFLVGIVFSQLNSIDLGDVTIQNLTYETIFTYLLVLGVFGLILLQVDKFVNKLAN